MTVFRRQKATFSIPDGQLTSALNPKLHFPQILSAKHPCHAARFPQSAPESFRSLDATPGRTTPKSRARRFEHPCQSDSCPVTPKCPTSTARDRIFVVITRARPIPDLARRIIFDHADRGKRHVPVQCDNAPAGSHLKEGCLLLCGTLSRGTLGSAVVSVAQPKLSRCASLQRHSCATALTALRLNYCALKAVVHPASASTHKSPELGTRPSILSLLRIASGSFGDVPGFPQDCVLCLVPGCHTLPPVLYEAEAPRSFRADLCLVPLVMPLLDGSKSLLGQHQPQYLWCFHLVISFLTWNCMTQLGARCIAAAYVLLT